MLAPLALLGVWGYSYLCECVDVLSAPGVPIEFPIRTPSGFINLRATSYSIGIRSGLLKVTRPKLYDPSGKLLASAEQVLLSGVEVLRGTDQPFKVTITDLYGRLTRLKNGKFQLQYLLPTPSAKPSVVPFSVEVKNAKFDLVDEAGTRPYHLHGTSGHLWVAGLGDSWTSSGKVVLDGIGVASTTIHRSADHRFRLDLDSTGLEVATLLEHLKETPEGRRVAGLDNVRAGSVVLKGPTSVVISDRGAVSILSQSDAVVTRFAYRDYSADLVTFRGAISQDGAVGRVDAKTGQNSASFDGSVNWRGSTSAGGLFTVHAQGLQALSPSVKSQLPSDLVVEPGDVKGWMSYSDPKRYSVQGSARVNSVSLGSETLSSVESDFAVDPRDVVINVRSAQWTGQTISGGVDLKVADRSVQGGIHAPAVDLAALGHSFLVRDFSGTASGEAVFHGSSTRPVVAFSTNGRVRYSAKAIKLEPLDFEASGTYKDGQVLVSRADVSGTEGEAFALGSINSDRALNLQVAGRHLQVSQFLKGALGQANVEASVTGTLGHPSATGRAEAYALQYQGRDIPLVTTDFSMDPTVINFTNTRAIQGATQADASGKILLGSQHITFQAKASGVQLADYLGEKFIGVADISNVSIVGSIASPLVSGDLTGDSLVMGGIKVDHVQLHASLDRNGISLDNALIQVAGGTVTATGDYDFGAKLAHVQAQATPMRIRDLTETYSSDVTVGGTISGKADLELEGQNIKTANASGRLKGVVVNGTYIGDGPVTVSGVGTKLDGSLEVGQLERFLALRDLHFDYGPDRPTLSGEADLFNISLSDIINTGIGYFPGLSYDTFNTAKSAQGAINASILFSGDAKDPAIDVTTLEATGLAIHGEDLGALTAQFRRGPMLNNERAWNIKSLRLGGGPGTLTMNGKVSEGGAIHLDGDLSGLELSKLSGLDARLGDMSGEANASFTVDGQTAHPTVLASLSANGLFKDPTAKNDDRSLRVELAPVKISETKRRTDGTTTGGIEVSGSYFYRGFVGQVSANAPLKYPFEIPDDEPISGELTVDDRSLKDIAAIVGGIDAKRTDGKVGGKIDASGTTQKISLKGKLSLLASTFASEGIDDTLKDFGVDLELEGDTMTLRAKGTSGLGGILSAEASTQPGDLSSALSRLTGGGVDSLLGNSVKGNLHFDKLKFRQNYPQRAFVQGALSGDVAIGGTFRRPTLSGTATLLGLDSVMPGFETKPELPSAPLINPSFNLSVLLGDTAHVAASTADMYVTGGGKVGGTLTQPQLTANLDVQKGQLKLPASTIRLEDGGTVVLNYQATRTDTFARLDVDLTGLTQVTAPGAGDTIQRYDVTLGVKGDLLSANGLSLTASSDPPDLSQDRILGLLGQTDVLQSLNPGSGVSRSEAQRQVQSALAGFALPSLVDPITSSIAKSLGLDYLEVGFNPYQEATFSFAKSLGGELTLQGSRGLSQPPPGYPFQYDYRLVLHPRRFGKLLSRFSLFLGTDQDNPYKFGLIYSTRF